MISMLMSARKTSDQYAGPVGADEAIRLTPPLVFSLEQAMEFLDDDELVEVTPTAIRIRKKILNRNERTRLRKKKR